jgi:hypothetical protein
LAGTKRFISAIDPRAYQQIVGATFAKHDHRPLIVIGDRQWNRWELGRLGAPHPAAAERVNRVIKTLQIRSTSEFLAQAHAFTEYKDFGVTSYWVVLALIHDLGERVETFHGKDNPSFAAMHRHAMKRNNHKPRRNRKGQMA